MKKTAVQQIVILGCGNVAWHLAKLFSTSGNLKVTVCNHKPNALLNDFRLKLKCKTEDNFDHIPAGADFYFLCLSDKALAKTAASIQSVNPNAIFLHTSGSMPLNLFGKRIQGTAVFYPLQTFTRADDLNWTEVPVLLETRDKTAAGKIKTLANRFEIRLRVISQEQRYTLHLAAVLVNNFTNAMFVAASELLDNKIKFEVLLPLIRKTVTKLETMSPATAQTGPARRGDKNVMKKHLDQLEKNPDLQKVYKAVSRLIKKQRYEQS